MPRPPRKTDHAERATEILDHVASFGTPDKIEHLLQVAHIHATLAVAGELSSIREHVNTVADNLEDREGASVALHLHYISDWLEKISSRPLP